MKLSNDEQLMQNYGQRGDIVSFNLLYQRYRKPLFAFIRQKMPATACNEVFQNVWESLIKQANNYQAPAMQAANDSPDSEPQSVNNCQPFRAYLYTIARRRIADYWRNQSTEHQQDYDVEKLIAHSNPELCYQQESDKRIILRCVSRLPKNQQDAFLLKQSGLKISEMAEVLESSFDAVKSRIRVAYQCMRECWEKSNA